MTHVLAIARREIEERAFVFVAAIAIALVPLIVLALPQWSLRDRLGAVVALGFILAVAFTWALALILGATLVGRELSEKRISFYFTRPLSGSSIWFGKLIAAVVLLGLCFAIVHALPLGIGGSEWQTMSTITRSASAAQIALIALILLLGGHLLSTWVRSHSPILALDFVATLAFGAFSWPAIILPLRNLDAHNPADYVVAVLVAAAIIAAVAGGAWQLERGRIDLRRGHRELSICFWSLITIAVAAMYGYSWWVLAVKPRELVGVRASQNGAMVQMEGAARDFWPHFVVNPVNGAFRLITFDSVVAENGDVVAIGRRNASVNILRLESKPRTLALFPAGDVKALAVTRDGMRLAADADDGILTIYDVPSRHAIASTRIGPARNPQLRFESPSVLRAFLPAGRELRVRDFDLSTKKWTDVTGPLPIRNEYEYRVAGPVLMTRSEAGVEIRDLQNPAAVQTVAVGRDDGVWRMRDGSLAIFHRQQPASVEIRRNGEQQLIHFDRGAAGARVVGEMDGGKLLATSSTRLWTGERGFDSTTFVVNAGSGVIERTLPHVWPAITWPSDLGASDPAVTFRALLHRDTGKVDVIDLRTGAIRPLF